MKNVVVSVKMTEQLKDRIDTLARKSDTNRNRWIIKTLTRASNPRIKRNKGINNEAN